MPITSLNTSYRPAGETAKAQTQQNGRPAMDGNGKTAFYFGNNISLPLQQCKRGAYFIKQSVNRDQAAITNLGQNTGKLNNNPVELKSRLDHLAINLKNSNQFIQGKNLSASRFPDIPTAIATQVIAPDGKALAANRVCIDGKNVAIASQYPKEADLSSYFKMLVENRTPALVVLASNAEIAKQSASPLPAYFRESKDYPDNVKVTVKNSSTTQLGSIKTEQYTLAVSISGDKKITIPVIHVTDWPDREALSAADTQRLVNHVNKIKNEKIKFYEGAGSKAVSDENKLLPVIHCRAGVGRTGQLIAATALMDGTSKNSLESIVTDMRESRNQRMVQTEPQMDQLIMMAAQLNKPLLKNELPRENNELINEPIYANITSAPPRPTAPKPPIRHKPISIPIGQYARKIPQK